MSLQSSLSFQLGLTQLSSRSLGSNLFLPVPTSSSRYCFYTSCLHTDNADSFRRVSDMTPSEQPSSQIKVYKDSISQWQPLNGQKKYRTQDLWKEEIWRDSIKYDFTKRIKEANSYFVSTTDEQSTWRGSASAKQEIRSYRGQYSCRIRYCRRCWLYSRYHNNHPLAQSLLTYTVGVSSIRIWWRSAHRPWQLPNQDIWKIL